MKKALRTFIILGEIRLEVFQMPDGSYQLSQTQIALAVGKEEVSTRQFLASKSPHALPYKGFRPVKSAVEGENHKVNLIPIEIAAAYWLKETLNGNPLAAATLAGCVIESIQRRADKAFGVKTSEEEYNEKLAEIRQIGKRTRRKLTDSVNAYIVRNNVSPYKVKTIYINVSERLNLILFGKNARKLRADRNVVYTRDGLTFEELRNVENLENAACVLIDQKNIDPVKAINIAFDLLTQMRGLSA